MTDSQTEQPAPIVMSDLAQSAMVLCAARHDASVDYDAFTDLVHDLVSKAREEERELSKKIVPPAVAGGGGRKKPQWPTRKLTADDIATIASRAAAAPRDLGGRLPRGFGEQLAGELGLTKSQIKTALYDKR